MSWNWWLSNIYNTTNGNLLLQPSEDSSLKRAKVVGCTHHAHDLQYKSRPVLGISPKWVFQSRDTMKSLYFRTFLYSILRLACGSQRWGRSPWTMVLNRLFEEELEKKIRFRGTVCHESLSHFKKYGTTRLENLFTSYHRMSYRKRFAQYTIVYVRKRNNSTVGWIHALNLPHTCHDSTCVF